MKRFAKRTATGLLVVGAYLVGDLVNPLDRAKEEFRNTYMSREEGFYKGELELITKVNENKREEIYLQDKATGALHPISQYDSLPTVNAQVASLDYKAKDAWQEFQEDLKETVKGAQEEIEELVNKYKGRKENKPSIDTTLTLPGDKEQSWLKEKTQDIKEYFRK